MASVIGEAFVRIRPLAGAQFRSDVQRQTRSGLSGLGRIVGGALGVGVGFGIAREIDKTLEAAKDAEVVARRLDSTLAALGLSSAEASHNIEEQTQALSKLAAFDDEELLGTFTQLVRRTGDVNEALRLNALAANVSRGSGFALATVAKAIGRAYDGQVTGLSRLGIAIKKGVSGQEALRQVQERYAGSAAAVAATATGTQDKLNKSLEDSREIIGGSLLPVVTDLSGEMAEYLDRLNESGELQKRVNTALDDGAEIVSALAGAFNTARSVIGPFIEGVGGLENAIQLAIGAKLITTAAKAVTAIGTIAAAFGLTTRKVVADAAVMGAAIDTATRPRAVPIQIAPGGLPVGRTGRTGGGGGVPPVVGFGGPIGIALLGLTAGLWVKGTQDAKRQAAAANVQAKWAAMTPTEQREFLSTEAGRKAYDGFTRILGYDLPLKPIKVKPGAGAARSPDSSIRAPGRTIPDLGEGASTGRTQPPTRLQNLRLELAEAERDDDLARQRRIQAAIVAIYRNRVQNTKLTGQALARFKEELSSEETKLDGIQDSINAQSDAAAAERQTKAEQRRSQREQSFLRRLARGRRPFEAAVERAAGTEGLRDDVRTAKALRDRIVKEIQIVRASTLDTQAKQAELDRLSDDYAQAVSRLNDAKRTRSAALAAAAEESRATRAADLDKILQLAELTEDPAAINRALDAAIANAKKILKKATDSGKGVLDALLNLETLKKRRRELLKQSTTGQQGTTAFDLLSQFGGRFTGGNLINSDQPFQGPSGFQDDTAPFLIRRPGFKPRGATTSTTGGAAVSMIDKLIAALDRNTAATNGSTSTVKATKVPSDRRADAARANNLYYESLQARANVERRGGV